MSANAAANADVCAAAMAARSTGSASSSRPGRSASASAERSSSRRARRSASSCIAERLAASSSSTPSCAASTRARMPWTGVRSSWARSATLSLRRPFLLLQRLGEAVEGVGDGRDLVVAGLRDARVQVAGAHGVGAGADAPQRPRERHREVQGDQHRDRRGDARRPPGACSGAAWRSWISSPVNSLPSSRLTTTVPICWSPTLTGAVAAAPSCTGADGGCENTSLPASSYRSTARKSIWARWCRVSMLCRVQRAVLGDDRGHVAEVHGGVVQPRARGGLEVGREADARVDGGHDRAQQGDGDERDHEAGAQAPAPAAAHSFASRYPTPVTVST